MFIKKSNQNKKIGLVSFYKDPNYGTMLQAYALARVIKQLGYNCEYISYYSYKKRESLIILIKSLVKDLLIFLGLLHSKEEFYFFNTSDFRRTKKAFNMFYKRYIPYSSKQYYKGTIVNANSVYDSFIVGSDQTWSPFMTKVFRDFLFLRFVDENHNKLSYAPSIGTLHITNEYKKNLAENLSRFNCLSCREKENSELLSMLLNKEVKHVLDPTLLLDKEDWIKLAKEVSGIPDKYILCYILGKKDCIASFAERLSKEKNIPVYYIITHPKYLHCKNALDGIGPQEFLYLVSRASYVVTDSFHGTIFSINFGINFYSFAKRGNVVSITNDNDRISLFLAQLKLSQRFKQDEDQEIGHDIDFSKIMPLLNKLKSQSNSYLKDILS